MISNAFAMAIKDDYGLAIKSKFKNGLDKWDGLVRKFLERKENNNE